LPTKTIFATPVFSADKLVFSTDWQKPANPVTWPEEKISGSVGLHI